MRFFVGVVFASLLLAGDSGQDLFQKGLVKERTESDFRGAIKLYERVVKQHSIDRKLMAQALLRIGECQQSLNSSEARATYERVVREFGDQPESAAQARKHLADLQSPAVPETAARRILTLPPKAEIFGGTISPNGRHIPFVSWAPEHHGDLFLHDFATGEDRRLTNTAGPGSPSPEDQFAEETSFSRDGKQLAYTWFDGKKDRYEIRVLNVDGTGIPPFRRLFENQEIFWVVPYDWSPDGAWIAVRVQRRDRSVQIGVVSTRDGSLRALKSVDWRGPTHMSFSLDGKYLAYDLPANDASDQRDVFVLAIDGSRETAAVDHTRSIAPQSDRFESAVKIRLYEEVHESLP